MKFQLQPQAEPSEIIIHVNMLDKENLQQQEALGIAGVNLCWGAFYLHSEPEKLIASLLDGLSTARIEVDMIKFLGPYFSNVDNRLMALQLVEKGLSNAALIGANGDVLQPSEVLHKTPILIERGSFRPVTYVNLDMLDGARQQFLHDAEVKSEDIVELMEITMSNLLTTGAIDHRDFLARADTINAVGKMVLISNYAEYYKLAAYLQRYTKQAASHRARHPEPQGALRREILRDARGRHPRVVRPPLQERPAALRLPLPRPGLPDLTTVETWTTCPST
ncbi:MAG: hypothetical protein WDO13_05050 [Verrucomicrobiota bacterium]